MWPCEVWVTAAHHPGLQQLNSQLQQMCVHTQGSEGPEDSGPPANPPGTDMSTERDQSHLTGFEKEPRRDGVDSRADTQQIRSWN